MAGTDRTADSAPTGILSPEGHPEHPGGPDADGGRRARDGGVPEYPAADDSQRTRYEHPRGRSGALGAYAREWLSDISADLFLMTSTGSATAETADTSARSTWNFSIILPSMRRHDIVWGLDYRLVNSIIESPLAYSIGFVPDRRLDNLAAVFLQDEIAIAKSVSLTLGSKFEHNAYTGFEYEPSAQIIWTLSDRQMFWASASRAIRQPSMLDDNIKGNADVVQLGGGAFAIATLSGDAHPRSETLRDFETGYRHQIGKRLSVDLTGFLSYYRNLEAIEPQDPFFSVDSGPPHLVIPETFAFDANGRDYGAEAFVNWDASSRLKITSGYSFLNMLTTPDASVPGSAVFQPSADSPRHQFQVRGHLRLLRNLDWDASAAWTSPIAGVPAYTRVDSRLGWRAGDSRVQRGWPEPRLAASS